MDYQWHYDRLMERARTRDLFGYSESHHVHPKCMGGSDDAANLVRLTAPEHYVAHQLLVKMNPGHAGLIWAAMCMTGKTGKMQARNNKAYGWLRERFAEMIRKTQTGKKRSAETIKKLKARVPGMLGKTHSEETRRKQSEASKGRKKSKEHCEAMSKAKIGLKKGVPQSESHKANRTASLRIAMKKVDQSYKQTPEYKEARRKQMEDVWRRRREGTLPPVNHDKPRS